MCMHVVAELVLDAALSQRSQTVPFDRTHLGATDFVASGGSIYYVPKTLCLI